MRETTLNDLADQYDFFLLDQFGVLLDGSAAYPDAPQALAGLVSKGKQVVVLSNSGKRAGPNEARLVRMGFDRADFAAVVSSGETAYALLSAEIGRTIAPKAPVLVLARDSDRSCIEGLDVSETDDPDQAALVLISGSRGEEISLETYETLLMGPARRGVACYCTNPDMTMLTKSGPAFGAGRIAALYEKLGGAVTYVGKPYARIYELAMERLGGPDPSRVLCVGDSPEHDVRGAHAAGCPAALVRTGVHAGVPLQTVLTDAPSSDLPDYVIPGFAL
ncbi:MAG: TIGR01459 family HAD-type hydrolase [Alphaproteobacteria bacterium]|nr:TIGR01459 family HAD-type hydrolase [Alphaproteobacteria bacterium]